MAFLNGKRLCFSPHIHITKNDDAVVSSIIDGTITVLNSDASIVRDSAMAYCANLTTATLPLVRNIQRYGFRNCTSLHTVDVGEDGSDTVINFTANAFNGASALSTLIIRSNTVATLQATSVFTTCPITNGNGFIYVPDTLVESYKTATNWSTYANQIKGLSELGV